MEPRWASQSRKCEIRDWPLFEVPFALVAAGGNDQSDVVRAAIETHVAGYAAVLVQAGELVVNAVLVRAGFVDGVDEQAGGVVTVTGVDVGLLPVSLFEAMAKNGPLGVPFRRIKKI